MKAWYRRVVQMHLHHLFGHLSDSTKKRIGKIILATHMLASATVWLMTAMVPITPAWVAFVLVGYLATAVHWYLLGGCCINPIENYFFGEPDADHSCFVNAYARALGIPDIVVCALAFSGPIFIAMILFLRWISVKTELRK